MSLNNRAEQELTRMEREFGEALTRRDTAVLKDLIADDSIGFNPLGLELTKADVLAQATSPDFDLESLRGGCGERPVQGSRCQRQVSVHASVAAQGRAVASYCRAIDSQRPAVVRYKLCTQRSSSVVMAAGSVSGGNLTSAPMLT